MLLDERGPKLVPVNVMAVPPWVGIFEVTEDIVGGEYEIVATEVVL